MWMKWSWRRFTAIWCAVHLPNRILPTCPAGCAAHSLLADGLRGVSVLQEQDRSMTVPTSSGMHSRAMGMSMDLGASGISVSDHRQVARAAALAQVPAGRVAVVWLALQNRLRLARNVSRSGELDSHLDGQVLGRFGERGVVVNSKI